MGGESALPAANGAAGVPASYWFDALEDGDALSGIEFADSESSAFPMSLDQHAGDDGFIIEIDRILESINGDLPVTLSTSAATVQSLMSSPVSADIPVDNWKSDYQPCLGENGSALVRRVPEARLELNGGNVVNGDGRYGKRARILSYRSEERSYSASRHDRYREFPLSRRWVHDRDERKRPEGGRKRDLDGREFRDREWRERESKGYWERDHRSGRMVFRVGSWEADANRETKKAKYDSVEQVRGGLEKRDEEKDKPAEEQARQYQLEVLEQAKKKNTIAFLETGAGKTLIAVLLMKSLCDEMMKENKKMLAIFLVPKVPLVYQVKHNISSGK